MIKLLALTGPTATGKTALSVRLAKALNGEIISGDSTQVYRGMDIGTAKVTEEEMEGVPHHLIDVLDIKDPFSAGAFAETAGEIAEGIHARGRVPIIAGGTGLYIDALTGGRMLSETADSNASVRESLMAKAEREGAEALHSYLETIDPTSAAEIHPNNVKRVARAIEIYLVTGKTKTELNSEKREQTRFKRLLFVLSSPDRDYLYRRINQRVDLMMEAGLLNEAEELYKMGIGDTPTAGQAIGYKEFFPYFEGRCTLEDSVEKVKQATRNYAKRQITYFKRMEDAVFLDCTEPKDVLFERAFSMAKEFLND